MKNRDPGLNAQSPFTTTKPTLIYMIKVCNRFQLSSYFSLVIKQTYSRISVRKNGPKPAFVRVLNNQLTGGCIAKGNWQLFGNLPLRLQQLEKVMAPDAGFRMRALRFG